ncbi:MAG: hypothetical protein ACLSHC_06510, partial [Bilophila wadsworthia]
MGRIRFRAGQNAGQNRVGLVPSLQEATGLLCSYLEIALISRCKKMQIDSRFPVFWAESEIPNQKRKVLCWTKCWAECALSIG